MQDTVTIPYGDNEVSVRLPPHDELAREYAQQLLTAGNHDRAVWHAITVVRDHANRPIFIRPRVATIQVDAPRKQIAIDLGHAREWRYPLPF